MIFLDTVGLIALWNKNDQWHAAASAVFQSLTSVTPRVVTTSYVLLECANDAARRPYRDDVVRLRDDLDSAGDLIEPTAGEIEQAWNEYRRGTPGSPGVVDLISFAVMRRLGITDAFTHNSHFTVAGFTTLF